MFKGCCTVCLSLLIVGWADSGTAEARGPGGFHGGFGGGFAHGGFGGYRGFGYGGFGGYRGFGYGGFGFPYFGYGGFGYGGLGYGYPLYANSWLSYYAGYRRPFWGGGGGYTPLGVGYGGYGFGYGGYPYGGYGYGGYPMYPVSYLSMTAPPAPGTPLDLPAGVDATYAYNGGPANSGTALAGNWQSLPSASGPVYTFAAFGEKSGTQNLPVVQRAQQTVFERSTPSSEYSYRAYGETAPPTSTFVAVDKR